MAQEITFFQVLKTLLILGVILVAVYYATKFIATKSIGKGFAIKRGSKSYTSGIVPTILYRYSVDKQTTMMLVEYDGHDYLLGVTGGSFTVIQKRKLSPEEQQSRQEADNKAPGEVVPFSRYWEQFKQNLGKKGGDKK